MVSTASRTLVLVLGVLAATATAARAQRLKAPDASPAATVMQTVGLTETTVTYHRPGINGRKVWGELVPFKEVWRAGANENTTVAFSSDVKVNGKPLKAGTYGMHMIPTDKDWTVIFSTMSVAWGSFTYDQKEDALRVTVTPKQVADSVERLSYRFDDPGNTKTTLVLAWEKLEVPIAIEVDTPKIVMESMRKELRGGANFTPDGWAQAAAYWLANGGNLDEALKMADKSIGMRATYANLNVRARILDKQGKAQLAGEARTKALALATENDLNLAGYQLINDKKLDEAIAMFRNVVQKYPESWNAQDSLGEALALKGDKAGAIAAYEKARSMTKDPVQIKRIDGVLARIKK